MAINGTNHRAAEKNIWIAAGDGDLERVRELIEHQGSSPNGPDEFTYTPMHAAASYGHLHVLDYLLLKGGDVNVTDNDGDTPIFTVENVETARWLFEHGASITHTNNEGVDPVAHLTEEFPEVAAYLQSVHPESRPVTVGTEGTSPQGQPSRYAEEQATEQLTSSLMTNAVEIMHRAEADGRDPDAELRRLVGDAVMQGVVTGYGMGEQADAGRAESSDQRQGETDSAKRQRTDQG